MSTQVYNKRIEQMQSTITPLSQLQDKVSNGKKPFSGLGHLHPKQVEANLLERTKQINPLERTKQVETNPLEQGYPDMGTPGENGTPNTQRSKNPKRPVIKRIYGAPLVRKQALETSLPEHEVSPGKKVTCSPVNISKGPTCVPSSNPTTDSPTNADIGSGVISDNDTDAHAPKLKKRVRGFARAKKLKMRVEEEGKLKIVFLPGETVARTNNDDLSTAIGIIVKSHADLDNALYGWQGVSDENKDFCYARLLHWFDFEDYKSPRVQRIIDQKFQKSYSCWKNTLHTAYKAQKNKGIEPREVSPRVGLTLEKWQLACDFIEDDYYQGRSTTNSDNRKKMPFSHTSGRTPMICRYKKMVKKSRIELFRMTRVSKKNGGKFVNPLAESKYEEMVEMQNDVEDDEEPLSESEIMKAKLGRRSGYIKGMGHGVEVIHGYPSNGVAGVEVNVTAKLENANAKIEDLTQTCDEQRKSLEYMKYQMSKWQKLLLKIPGISDVLSDDMDDMDGFGGRASEDAH